ncbi:transketolase-like TK C-terminal-containing protein, partial [Alteromonas abrolhosensis]
AVAWKIALMRSNGPTALVFSRQSVKPQARTDDQLHKIERGGYTLRPCEGEPDIILIATGSEVPLAVEAAEQLINLHDIKASVVSLPSPSVFLRQESTYQEQVLPPHVTCRLAIEAAHVDYWHKFVGPAGEILGLDSFGESAPGEVLFSHFGITVDNVIAKARKALAKRNTF